MPVCLADVPEFAGLAEFPGPSGILVPDKELLAAGCRLLVCGLLVRRSFDRFLFTG